MRAITLLVLLTLSGFMALGQDDLMEMLNSMDQKKVDYTFATFKTTRIVNGHSVETPAKGVMNMTISHRFGPVNKGVYDLFGLDQANMRIGLEYGVTDRICLGVGRSNILKTYDGYLKVKLLRQSTGKRVFPFTVDYVGGMTISTIDWANPDRINYYSSRLQYYHSILIASKVSEKLSIQLSPTLVHRNFVESVAADNDIYAVGIGGRLKLTSSLSLNAEYYYVLPSYTRDNTSDCLSIGIDLETGGHVFQLLFTNAIGMTENYFIPNGNSAWWNKDTNTLGDVRFGFALHRVFAISHHETTAEKAGGEW